MSFTSKVHRLWHVRTMATVGFMALLASHAVTVSAGQIQVDLLFDTSQSVPGCTVTTPERVINGVDQRVRVVADDVTKIVSTKEISVCSGSAFGAPQPISANWSYTIATNDDVIRGSIPKSLFPAPLLGVVLLSSAESGVVTDVLDGGNPQGFASLLAIADAASIPVPTLHPFVLAGIFACLITLGGVAIRRKKAIVPMLVIGVLAMGLLPIATHVPAAVASLNSLTIMEPAASADSEIATIGRGNILSTTIALDTTLNVYNVEIHLSPTINGVSVAPPPDPVANDATIAGIDVNKNGVRDDVERKIAALNDRIEGMMAAVKIETALINTGDASQLVAEGYLAYCTMNPISDELVYALLYDTPARKDYQSNMAPVKPPIIDCEALQ